MKITEQYRTIRDKMVEAFMSKYFKDEDWYIAEHYLIWSNEKQARWPLEVNNEYWFSMDEIYEALENDFELDDMLEWKDKDLELWANKRMPINFYNRCRYWPDQINKPKPTKEELEESAKAVEEARKILEKEILKHNQ